ncbi:unnamed protein product [Prorocentrum cordatum]|uniref:Uncharacterized protein n=1 Tax=Prorocentrum cordatum TaxID=2364126 RepID=A0ABN9VKH0_9DINO|nr:unnamed protein product [Polarella glacialis]
MIRVEVGSELFTQGVAPHYKADFSYTWTLAAPAPSGSRIRFQYHVGGGGAHCLYIDAGAALTVTTTSSFVVDCTGRNYNAQVSHCQSQGVSIASIHSDAENNEILSLLQSQNCNA